MQPYKITVSLQGIDISVMYVMLPDGTKGSDLSVVLEKASPVMAVTVFEKDQK